MQLQRIFISCEADVVSSSKQLKLGVQVDWLQAGHKSNLYQS